MSKRVIVIASGETERRSLPHLLEHLRQEDIDLVDIRFPPRHQDLRTDVAVRLVHAVWFERMGTEPPDKIVILVDLDGKQPEEKLDALSESLPRRLMSQVSASVLFAYAQWHLESWFFADEQNLRKYLGRNLGNVDASNPDQIQNPKLHLKNLLANGTYTAAISEEIAKCLDARTIERRSPSFGNFLRNVRNGNASAE